MKIIIKFAMHFLLLSSVGCNFTLNIDKQTEQKFLTIEKDLNNYISRKQTIQEYEGKVFCFTELIGGNDAAFYVIFSCKEFYQDGDLISVGSSLISPALIKVNDLEIVEIQVPGNGDAYSKDIQNMFPKAVSAKMLSGEYVRDVNRKFAPQFDALRKAYGEEVDKNKYIFKELFENKQKADFYAAGTEPFWTMYLRRNKLIFKNSSGQIFIFDMLNTFNNELPTQEIKFISHNRDTSKIKILKEQTLQELANQYYPYRVIRDPNATYLNGVGDIQPLNK